MATARNVYEHFQQWHDKYEYLKEVALTTVIANSMVFRLVEPKAIMPTIESCVKTE